MTSTVQPTWRNAIVRTENVPPGDLIPHPLNWRLHPAFQQQVLVGVLADVGWVDDILVNEVTGHILDGHLRVTLALEQALETVPVSYVHLTATDELQVLATLDPIAAMAAVDTARRTQQLDGLTSDNATVQTLIDGLLAPASDVDDDDLKQHAQKVPPKPKLEIQCVIGPYRFKVDLKVYTDWVNALYEQFSNDGDAVLGEIERRLGLHTL